MFSLKSNDDAYYLIRIVLLCCYVTMLFKYMYILCIPATSVLLLPLPPLLPLSHHFAALLFII